MGNSAPAGDARVQRCAEMLKMTKADIRNFHQIFRHQDQESKGFISINAFFQCIGESRSILGQALFELIGTYDRGRNKGRDGPGALSFSRHQKPVPV